MSEAQPIKKRSFLKNIFVSFDEPRLRAGWRLLLQTILMVIISIIVTIASSLVIPLTPGGNVEFLIGQVMELIVFVSSIYIARRFLDKRSFVSIGLQLQNKMFPDLLAGIAITFVMMGLIYILEILFGWLKFESFAWQVEPGGTVIASVAAFLFIFILVGFNEELLSRGYHLQTISSGLGMTWAVLISSAVFGIAHLGNPNATWVSAAGIFFAGAFLAYGFIRTGQLWLSIGLHIGWNFFEGVVFGFPVSGLDIYRLTRNQVSGPELWTGGAFGPEAGLIVLPALILGTGLIYFYTLKRNNKTN